MINAAGSIPVTLVVCSRNRGTQLQGCLQSIAQLAAPFAWELMLVDNGSTDDTAEVMKAFLKASQVPGRYLYEPTRGNGAGRNAAIACARGEIIAFTDDDCYLEPNYLVSVRRFFEDSTVGFMCGRILLHDPTDYPITINESCEPVAIPSGRFIRPGLFQGANMAFRREPLQGVGAFDPRFGAGTAFAGEDMDVAMRLSAAGWNGGYHPDAVVRHHHGRKAADVPALARFYWIGTGAVYMKFLLRPGLRWATLKALVRDAAADLKHARLNGLAFKTAGAWQYLRTARATT
jgi:glycosyltransferase involved in cell wall biosynthesis